MSTHEEKLAIVDARARLERAEADLAALALRIPELERERARVGREVAMTVAPDLVLVESRAFAEASRALDIALSDRQVARDAAEAARHRLRALRVMEPDFGTLPQL